MYKFLAIMTVIVFSLPAAAEIKFVNSYATLTDNGIRNYGKYNYINNNIDYNYKKIAEAENYIFGENFTQENIITRIARLEDNIFGRQYPNSTLEQRVNNIAYNYNKTANSNNLYKKTKINRFWNGLNQAFFGVPTGYTPPIYTAPYYNWGNSGIIRPYGTYNDYYGRTGWRHYNNSIGTGSGIHIID